MARQDSVIDRSVKLDIIHEDTVDGLSLRQSILSAHSTSIFGTTMQHVDRHLRTIGPEVGMQQ